MDNRYRSRHAPVPGSSVSETHPGWWRDRIEKEDRIRDEWYRKYGHHYNEEHPVADKVPKSQPMAYVRNLLEQDTHRGETSRRGTADITPSVPHIESEVPAVACGKHGKDTTVGYGSQCENRKQHVQSRGTAPPCDYPTPANIQYHDVVKDPVTSYSSSFGHHSYQQNEHQSSDHKALQAACSSSHTQPLKSLLSRHPQEQGKFCTSSDKVPATPQLYPDSSLAKLFEGVERLAVRDPVSDPEYCPKCCRKLCVCMPRRREQVPKDRGTGPEEELAPWPPSPWLANPYCGDRTTSEGDILRFRYRMTRERDLTSKTPMARMYDQMKMVEKCGSDKIHCGHSSFSCPACRPAYEAARGLQKQ